MKIHHDSIRSGAALMGVHLDDNETVQFARSLEEVNQQVFEVLYPELRALRFLPVNGKVDPGASFYTWMMMDKFGRAMAIEDFAADFPDIEVQAGQVTTPIKSYGDSYKYSVQELRAVAKARAMGLGYVDLDVARAKAAREACARELDTVIALGDSKYSIPGFLTNPLVPKVTIADDVLTGHWAAYYAAHPDTGGMKILQDLLILENYCWNKTKELEASTTMLLPTSLFKLIATTPISQLNPLNTILTVFKASAQHVREVESWPYLEAAGTGDDSLKPRIVTYKRDPSRIEAVVPIEFAQQPPQPRNMAWRVNCETRTGGTVIRYPYSVCYCDICGPA